MALSLPRCEVDGLRGSRGSPRVGGALAPIANGIDDAHLPQLAYGEVGGRQPSCCEVAGRDEPAMFCFKERERPQL